MYSWRLDKNDPMPKGKKREPSLREKEKQIEADLFDHIVTNGGKLTVLELVEKYVSLKTGVRHNTVAGYKTVINILKKESGFDRLEEFDKTDFSIFENADEMKKLYEKMKAWCHSKFDKNLIFIAGNTGVGKTHLIKCMANELINLNHVVLLTSSFAMHQDFVKSYSTRDLDEKSSLLDRYLNSEVLFIDDLGTELRQPNITINYLYQVINERKMNRLPTIITSNLDLYELKDYYDERISSRIIDKASSICIFVKGKDLRLVK